MDSYNRESLRGLFEKKQKSAAERRGSIFMTVLIIMIFAVGGIFYIKTAKPDIYSAALECIKSIAGKSEPQSTAAPQGEMLRSAEDLEFGYLSQELVKRFETDDFAAEPLKNAVITSQFGSRTDPVTKQADAGHHGIDLAAAEGSSIYAYRGGTVTLAENNAVYGNCILIDHGDIESFYGHLSSLSVKTGDSVAAGDAIGVIGSTGKSTGIHLHFEVRKNGERVDPLPYLYEEI